MTRRTAVLALAVAATAALVGCGDDGGGDDVATLDPAEAIVEVRFTDSSVPPEYHRSFVLTADAEEVAVEVDAYGEPKGDATEATPADTWTEVLDDVEAADDALLRSDDTDDGCTGGTTLQVRVNSGSGSVVDVTIGSCDDEAADAAREEWGRILAPLAELVDLDALTDGRSPLTAA